MRSASANDLELLFIKDYPFINNLYKWANAKYICLSNIVTICPFYRIYFYNVNKKYI